MQSTLGTKFTRQPNQDAIIIVNYGSQYSRLIARRIRELGVFSELVSPEFVRDAFYDFLPKGIILSGGPASVSSAATPQIPDFLFDANVPILGICYGMQLLTERFGGKVKENTNREYGRTEIDWVSATAPITKELPRQMVVWMSHGDSVVRVPEGFEVIAKTRSGAVAAIQRGCLYGLQFHPEVSHTVNGSELLRNFVYDVCQCDRTWTPDRFIDRAIEEIRSLIGDHSVVCGVSGGIDSAVTAALVHKAIGDKLTCIFVDNGLMRQGEREDVIHLLETHLGLHVEVAEGEDLFLEKLSGQTDPEIKRKLVGEAFIEVFTRKIEALGGFAFLAQGTLYPDVIESAGDAHGYASLIKSHHNVGGLPEAMNLQLLEPLRYLFKDEVRLVARDLGLPESLINRQPFPGPGLAVRIVGEVTRDRIRRLRIADQVVREEIEKTTWPAKLWQYFAVLTDLQRVGVMGDHRFDGECVVVRCVHSQDGMTAEWAKVPGEILTRISERIVNEVDGISTVLYDITNKPPSTIEWE